MEFKPYEYQKTAIKWIVDHPRCGLFLDMGLGKTVSTLTAVQHLLRIGEVSRILVIAPKKVAETTWTDEAAKWEHLHSLSVRCVSGGAKTRLAALREKADVHVIGRDNFVWLVKTYNERIPFDMVILDELTSFKSPSSRRFKAMKGVTQYVRRVVGLTGTPAPNGLMDLWAQMYCIDRGERLGEYVTRYRDTYFSVHKWNNIVVRCDIRKGCDEIIRRKIADICLPMKAEDYLQLPGLIVHNSTVSLSEAVMEEYKNFERDKVLEFQSEHADERSAVLANSAAGLMNKLSQFANGAVYNSDGLAVTVHDEKTDRLAEIVEAANGESVLVFYQYRHDISRITERLKDYAVRVYKDEQDLRDWNNHRIDVLLAHPASTAYGLNMQQGGRYIVWFGTGWNLEHYSQANARLYRQGQTKPVIVYRLVCAGTVDEYMCGALEAKKNTQRALLDGLKYLISKHAKEKD